MKQGDVLKKAGLVVRILIYAEPASFVVDCLHPKMPFLQDNEFLATMEPVPDSYRVFFTDEELTDKQKEVRDRRFSIIQPIIEPWFIMNKAERNQAIQDIAKEKKISQRTIKNYLWQFWVGQSKNALLPEERLPVEVKELTGDQKNMRWALNKFYYTTKRHTLKTAYQMLLKEKYCDAMGTLVAPYPTYWQFRYFFQCHRDPVNEAISRQGLKAYQRNHRAFTGDVRAFAACPGTYMTDATMADIYIVSKLTRKVIGRPIIYTMVDAHTNMITGLYVGLEGGKNALRMLMMNTVSPKAAYCSQYDVGIRDGEWDTAYLPKTIMTDRGTEFIGDVMENICEEYGVDIINLPAYRPDLKGPVEKLFDLLQEAYKPFLKGKGVIEADYQERGAHDYRKDSTLDLEQFTAIVIKCVLYFNNHHVMQNFQRSENQILGGVPPIAAKLWNFSANHLDHELETLEDIERFKMALLPRANGCITQRGLEVFSIRYNNDEYKKRFVRAGAKGREKVVVAYTPDDLSKVWLYEDRRYVPFEVIQQQYRGKNLAELTALRREEKGMNKALLQGELQAKVNLIGDIEDIAARALPTGAQTIKAISTGVRGNRQAEKKRSKGVFEILQAGVNANESGV